MKYAKGVFICTILSTLFSWIVMMCFSGWDLNLKLPFDTAFIILFITNTISIITLVIHESQSSGK